MNTSSELSRPPGIRDASEPARARALARFAILQPHIDEGVPLREQAEANGMSLRTAQRWLQAYRAHGLAGLVRKQRIDVGSRRMPDELAQCIEGLALRRPPPTAVAVHRRVAKVCEERGWATPSYGTVYDIIQQLDHGLVTLAHHGAKAHAEAFDLIYRREASRSNEIWQADHTLLDIWVLDHRDKPARPWLTAVLDDFSRALAGYLLSLDAPSALNTALALRQAIGRKSELGWHVCGIPDVFYTDHGSDFTSRHLEQVAADIKMQLVFSTAGVPRGRGKIERFFLSVNQLLLCELPGYAPAGTARPEPKLLLSDLDRHMRRFIVDGYLQRVHSEIGVAPQERWESSAFIPRLPESPEQLDLLFLTVPKSRRVHPDGIRFQGMRYMDLTLAAYVGESVTIRYDPRDLAEIRVFHRDAFLYRAICAELAGQSISLKDLVRARRQRRRELTGEIRHRSRLVDQLLDEEEPTVERKVPDTRHVERSRKRLKRYRNE